MALAALNRRTRRWPAWHNALRLVATAAVLALAPWSAQADFQDPPRRLAARQPRGVQTVGYEVVSDALDAGDFASRDAGWASDQGGIVWEGESGEFAALADSDEPPAHLQFRDSTPLYPQAGQWLSGTGGRLRGAMAGVMPAAEQPWNDVATTRSWQFLPDGLLYKQYLASVREPRLGGSWTYETANSGVPWDIMLGGRVGLLRWGSSGVDIPYGRPDGWQWDAEGAAIVRLDLKTRRDLIGSDFRAGTFLTRARGPWESRFGYYHLSAHAGDELLLRTPGFLRINYTRDVIVLGLAYRVVPDLRLYSEGGYSVANGGGSQPWEFQFGADYSPVEPTLGLTPAPFVAVNGHLREELNFGGNFVVQTGWQWRSQANGHLLRTGLEYYNGKSRQQQLFNRFEQQIGMGVWYDY